MLITSMLIAIGGLVSFLLPCVTPFGALAACAVLRGGMRSALLVVTTAWAVNEIAGFTLFHYPQTADSYTWAALSLIAALAATMLGSWAAQALGTQSPLVRGSAVLAITTVGFELALAAGALSAGRSMDGFALDVDLLVVETNVLFFIAFEATSLLSQTIASRLGARRA